MHAQTHMQHHAQTRPEGFHAVTPFIMVENTEELIEFMKDALDAKEIYVLRSEDERKIMHAQMQIGDSMIMLADTCSKTPEPAPATLHIYTRDADALYKKALEAGATSVKEPEDQFYGDRSGGVKDKFGNTWWFATHIEDVPEDEIESRAREFEKEEMNKLSA